MLLKLCLLNLYSRKSILLLLLLLSCFSRVRLCVTPQMAAHQASLFLGFSKQEYWSGLPFPSPMHKSEKWKVKVKSLRYVRLFETPWTAAYQAPPSMRFSRQEYWSRVPLPSLERPYNVMLLPISSQLCAQWHHIGSLKSAMVGPFTPWKSAYITVLHPPGKPAVRDFPAHHCSAVPLEFHFSYSTW